MSEQTLLKVELGGGVNPLGGEWINVDLLEMPGVDRAVDFERLGKNGVRLPFGDDAVQAVYSAHCLEHVNNVMGVWREVARICVIGGTFEMRVPHWLADVGMCPGHKHCISEHFVEDICYHFVTEWWNGSPKRLLWLPNKTEKIRWSRGYDRARRLFPHMNEQDILDFVPGTCHEVRFHFAVIRNEHYAPPAND